ncbi:serine hydrolase [Rhizobium sp. CCGE532]|uniref:serine hydrolase domain-containing protein n=1 Tax=Rhizobium sp. CCGE532 TaxID=2364272 RepID=UPI000EA9086D|nr:serine hydrolase [Rhizobium sp. CCGE532]AYG76827.1 hypothetical protein CCGE532_30400 [Rhizobium sp. CCGE532]
MSWKETMIRNVPYDLLPSGGVASLNWTPEQQVIAFRRRSEIDPVRKIGSACAASSMPLALHQISPHWTWSGDAMDVDRYMDQERVSGIIVLKEGKVLLERYGLGRTLEDLWDSQSVTKSVAGILVGAAIQDGCIESVEEAVTRYIPELEGSAYDDVTIRQLLTMTSGIEWIEDYTDDVRSDDSKMFMPTHASSSASRRRCSGQGATLRLRLIKLGSRVTETASRISMPLHAPRRNFRYLAGILLPDRHEGRGDDAPLNPEPSTSNACHQVPSQPRRNKRNATRVPMFPPKI